MPAKGSIRVGNAYILITPEMNQAQLKAQLALAEKEIAAFSGDQAKLAQQTAKLQEKLQVYLTKSYGQEAAKRVELEQKAAAKRAEYNKTETAAYLKAIAAVTEAEAAAEKARTAAKEKAARARERIALNARDLEVKYGKDTAASYLKSVETMKASGTTMYLTRINEAKQWSALEIIQQRKVAAEQAAQAKARAAQVSALSKLVIRQAQMEAAEQTKAARTAQAAYTAAHNTRKAQILAELATQRAASLAGVQAALAQKQAAKDSARETIRQNNGLVRTLEENARKVEKSWTKSMYTAGSTVNAFGTNMAEFGRSIQRNITTPLLTAAAAMSAMGITAADSMVRAQTALQGMGVSNKDAAKQIQTLRDYGTQTPYSVQEMFTYGAQYSRSGMSHGMTSTKATDRATTLVMSIGDLAAAAGITDPEMVKRAMVAVGNIQESDRAGLRNVRTLAESAGLDIQTLARLLGFKDRPFTEKELAERKELMEERGVSWNAPKTNKASSQLMKWMQDAKTTGGVPGEAIVDAIIDQGKKAGTGTDKAAGVVQGSATITARMANMWESSKFGLAEMFVSPTGKDGAYEYTGAGEALMGKGGLLDTVTQIGKDFKGPSGKLITELFEDLTVFADWVKSTVQVLKDNPGLTDMLIEAGKWAALLGGGAIVLGGVIKLFGALLKMGSPLAGIAKGAFKAGRGGLRVAGQAARGAQAGLMGGDARAAYRAQRGVYNDGDTRSAGRRLVDRVRGRNSQVEEIQVSTTQAQRNVQELDQEISDLKARIRDLKSENLRQLANEFAGQDSSVKAKADQAAKAVRDTETAVKNLRSLQLQDLEGEFEKVTGKDDSLTSAVKRSGRSVSSLDNHKLDGLDGEFTGAKEKSNDLTSAAKGSIKQVNKLNALALTALKGEVSHVKDETDTTTKKVGPGKSSLIGRIGQLNSMKTSDIADQIKKLGDRLKDTAGHADDLNTKLDNISKHTPGSGGSSKKKKKALGGVLPGYTPGRDVHQFVSPTAGVLELSGGESVMRPEWTAAVGPGYVNEMNQVARTQGVSGIRQAMKFAKGGIVGKLGLDKLIDLMEFRNLTPDILASFSTMRMDSSSRELGGTTQAGVVGAGTAGSKFVGSDLATKFTGLYNFTTKDMWKFLKKAPSGVGQLAGILGGALSPISGQYFWDDVWKGKGNVLERGSAYLNDMFSMKTLKGFVSNLFGGAWDTVKSLWDVGTDLVTDPVGTVEGVVSGVWDLVAAEYGGMVDMVKGLRQIVNSPLDYASQVLTDTYSTAKEALPNTEGLFDFSGEGLSSKKPDVSSLIDGQMSTPGAGSSVTRWTPQVKMALAQLGLPASALDLVLRRIKVESGGNPKAINNWDSNAKAGHPSQGLMQTIPSTFAAYAGPYRSRGITDPMASIYAGLNYAVHRYGSGWQKALSGTKGYASGTSGADRGWAWVGEEGPELVNFKGGETVLNHPDSMVTSVKVLKGYASGTGTKRTTGIAADAEKGVSSLNSAVKKLYQIITQAFTSDRIGSGTANSLNKWLDGENKKLQKLVKERAGLAPKLKEANAKLAQVKKDESEMASSISDKAKGLRSLTSIFNSDGVSVSSAISGLKQRLAAIKTFQANISTLTKRGFSKEIIAEIAQAGPEEGGTMAKELLNATEAQISDFNKTYASIGKASDSLGKSVAGSYYKAGKAAAQSLVDGLTAKDNKLKKQIEGLADTIVKTLKKKLGVNSKTPVAPGLATLLTWLTGESQAVKGKSSSTKKTTKVTTSYSTDSKGRKVVTVTTTTYDPAKGTTTTTTERTVGGKTTKSTKVTKTKGYATGTRSASPGLALVGERGPELVRFGGGERVHNARETAGMMGPRYEIHIHEAKSEDTTQAVLRAMKYAEVMAAM
ncbi:transglycosylase SLT domain-containing protein [Streptomyces prunicolor]|uniref:transglycosylase SLT domain-containing protein n=1 Tax=Streptomyces prunicolor TaxID=67348 RepID=UPI0033C90B60